MNFMSELLRTQRGHNAIWVIVDRMTKSAHFLPVNMKCSLEKPAKFYVDEIVRLHGIPVSMIEIFDLYLDFSKITRDFLGTKMNFSKT